MKAKYIYMIVWLLLVLIASFAPSNDLPKVNLFPNADKVIHWGMYLGLSFLLIPALLQNKKYNNSYILSFLIALIIGILIEYLQPRLSVGRSADFFDGMADGIGAITGIIIYQLVVRNKKIEKVIFKI